MRVAIATCLKPPEPDPDEQVMLDALRAAGMDAAMLAWDDPAADPAAFDVCVIRSTWNYVLHLEQFRSWLQRAAEVTRLQNPLDIVLGNLHKEYLLELGVPSVPTALFRRGEPARLAELGWQEEGVVIKPAVSAGSYRTERFEGGGGQEFLDELLGYGDVLVQPFLGGEEIAVVNIDGECTHAIQKRPRFDGEDEVVSDALPVPDELERIARRALPPGLLYARADFLRKKNGPWLISELELVEPSLFFLQYPPALTRWADAISRTRNV